MRSNLPPEERFWSYVDRRGADECWPWIGAVERSGYPRHLFKGRRTQSHRIAFAIEHGREPHPLGLHRCDNRRCVNPAHIFEGSYADNTRDMVAKGRSGPQRKTHCKHGHEFTAENTAIWGGWRCCRTCHRAKDARRNQREQVSA